MHKFIDLTIKPVLIIGGAGTALAGIDAFFPRFAVETELFPRFDSRRWKAWRWGENTTKTTGRAATLDALDNRRDVARFLLGLTRCK
jgi:hypothetical protein